jgi:hypothetical protein
MEGRGTTGREGSSSSSRRGSEPWWPPPGGGLVAAQSSKIFIYLFYINGLIIITRKDFHFFLSPASRGPAGGASHSYCSW